MPAAPLRRALVALALAAPRRGAAAPRSLPPQPALRPLTVDEALGVRGFADRVPIALSPDGRLVPTP
jgi:hypothetical protein